jgi:putative membrane protein
MSPGLRFFVTLGLNAVALMLLPELISGLSVSSYLAALVSALLIALINMLIRPFLLLITLPITVLSLGIFALLINASLFWLVSGVVSGLHVDGFWTAFWAALLYSLLTGLIHLALGNTPQNQFRFRRQRPPS